MIYNEDRIEVMWQMVRLVREMRDTPMVWKLTDPYLEAVAQFLSLQHISDVLCSTFLDASIDKTTKKDSLIATNHHYDFELFVGRA